MAGVHRPLCLCIRSAVARDEIVKGHPQGGRAADYGTGNGQAAPEGPSDVSKLRPAAAPGGDPTGGGPLDLAFLTGESGNIEFAPLPVPILPPKGRTLNVVRRAPASDSWRVRLFQ
jgi:hypothetical protein